MKHEEELIVLCRRYLTLSVLWLLVSVTAGFLVSLELTMPTLFYGIPYLHFGRLRPVHVNGVAFGWLTNVFFGLSLYITQRLCRKPLVAFSLAKLALPLWNATVFLGVVSVVLGQNQGLELAEFPAWVDVLVVLCFVMMFIPIIATIATSQQPKLYVSLWYITAAYIWTALNYVMGNTLPVWVLPGAAGANIHSTYLHDVVGLWVTPIGIAIMYYCLPLLTQKPIYSHKLSLIGFWGLAFFYPLNTAHHYLLSPIPMWVQVFAITASFTLIAVVYSAMHNFFATMSGKWSEIASSIPLRFLLFGSIFYVITCTQGPMQAQVFMQKIIHFTDWVIAHAHLALLGVFTFWNFAAIYLLWEKWSGRKLNRALSEWHFWLTTIGFLLYFIPLTAAGLLQGFFWKQPSVDFMESVRASIPFWWIRSFSGLVIVTGQFVFAWNLFGNPSETQTQKTAEAAAS